VGGWISELLTIPILFELMTAQEHVAKLQKQVQAIAANKPFAIAVQSVHALRVLRIFDKGIDGASYNKSKEIWVENTQLRRTNSGKSGRASKVSYFKSYYDLKANQGFDPNKVNLRLTNDLQSDFANAQMTSGAGRPPVGKAIKVNDYIYVEALRRSNNVKKLRQNIKRYGDFTRFTAEERSTFAKVLTFETNKLLQGK